VEVGIPRKTEEELVAEWRRRDPLLEDIEGFKQFLDARQIVLDIEAVDETPVGLEEPEEPTRFEKAFASFVKKVAPTRKWREYDEYQVYDVETGTVEKSDEPQGGITCDTPLRFTFVEKEEIQAVEDAMLLPRLNWNRYCVAMDSSNVMLLVFPDRLMRLCHPSQFEETEQVMPLDVLFKTSKSVFTVENDVLFGFLEAARGMDLVRIESRLSVIQDAVSGGAQTEEHVYLRAVSEKDFKWSKTYLESTFPAPRFEGDVGAASSYDPILLAKILCFKQATRGEEYVWIKMALGKDAPLLVHLAGNHPADELLFILAPKIPVDTGGAEWEWGDLYFA